MDRAKELAKASGERRREVWIQLKRVAPKPSLDFERLWNWRETSNQQLVVIPASSGGQMISEMVLADIC